MFGFLLLRGDKLHPEAFMEEKNEAMMVREPWLEIINKQGNQNPSMLTIIKPSVRLTQSDNVRARFNSSNRHSLRYYRLFFDKFFTQYPDKEKGRLKTEFGFSDDLFAWGSESGERVASGLRLGMPFSVGVFFDGGTHAGSVTAVHEHDRFAVEGVAVAAVVGDDRFVVVQF